MGLRDRLRNVTRNVAGVAGDVLAGWAEDEGFWKAKEDPDKETKDSRDLESQERGPGGDQKDQANNAPPPDQPAVDDPKSLFWDPFSIIEQLGYKEKPSNLSYGTLRAMVWKTPIVQAIINTRIDQVAAFCRPSRSRYDLGFKFQKRGDPYADLMPEERKWSDQMSTIIMRSGVTTNPRGRDNFETFTRKVIKDSLIYDQLVFESVANRLGQPAEWYAVDGSTIRIADSGTVYLDEDDNKSVRYVQIYDGMIITEYNQEELAFGVRNPSSDIRLFGYGVSELEMLMQVITALLWGWEYNVKSFSQGSVHKGILNFKGAIPDKQLKAFRRHWYQMLSGVENAWRTPITNADDLQWISMHSNARDMEFPSWFDFLIKLACFTPETPVVLSDGSLKRIDELKPGEQVLTHMGRPQKVLNIQIKDFEGDLICLRSGGEVIRTTPEHPFLVARATDNSWMAKDFDEPEWVKAEELVPNRDYLIVPKPRASKKLETLIDWRNYLEDGSYLEESGCLKARNNRTNAFQTCLDLTESNAFVLGLFAAEGSAGSGLSAICWSFHEEEKDYVQLVEVFLEKLGLSSSVVQMPKRHCVQVRTHSVVWRKALRLAFGDYSKTRKVPKEILGASREVQKAFLSGVIGGDGSVYDTGRTIVVSISTASYTFAQQLKQLLLGQGVWSSIYEHQRATAFRSDSTMFDLRIMGRYVKVVNEWLLGPKGKRLSVLLETMLAKKGRGIGLKTHVRETASNFYVPLVETWEEPYSGPVFNCEVDGEHSYQVANFAVHNCAMYRMDPVEVNFKYGNVGQKGALSESSNKDKITESKERGLRPLLTFYQDLLNRHLIWPINEDMELVFAGLDSMTKDEAADLNAKRVKTTHTVNELRAEDGMDAIEGGDTLLDPTWAQQQNMAAQQAMGDEGGFGPDFGDDEDEDEEGDKDDKKGPDFKRMAAALEEDEGEDEEEATGKKPLQKSGRKVNGKQPRFRVDVRV